MPFSLSFFFLYAILYYVSFMTAIIVFYGHDKRVTSSIEAALNMMGFRRSDPV